MYWWRTDDDDAMLYQINTGALDSEDLNRSVAGLSIRRPCRLAKRDGGQGTAVFVELGKGIENLIVV